MPHVCCTGLALAPRCVPVCFVGRDGRTPLRATQQAERANDAAWAPWRAHSLNFDREHGGDKGEPWRRMFMSDLATAFAVLALL